MQKTWAACLSVGLACVSVDGIDWDAGASNRSTESYLLRINYWFHHQPQWNGEPLCEVIKQKTTKEKKSHPFYNQLPQSLAVVSRLYREQPLVALKFVKRPTTWCWTKWIWRDHLRFITDGNNCISSTHCFLNFTHSVPCVATEEEEALDDIHRSLVMKERYGWNWIYHPTQSV
jgi:hypothetical protein